MLHRCLISSAVLLALATPAVASDLYPLPDGQIATAALQFRQRNYRDAWESASTAPQGGVRAFILGISAARLEHWGDAANQLATAADSFPLLADYALFNEANALYRLARFSDAVTPLQRLCRDFPDSPLLRSAQLLYADTFYEMKDFTSAYAAYQKFIEKFPSGPDSMSAAHKSALCLEQQGDSAGAVAALKTIWLKYPASTFAAKAEAELSRLAAQGARVDPYTPEELLRRATALYDLKRYDEAVKALQSVPPAAQPAGTADRFFLKAGQALFKSRHYKDAETAFSSLLAKKTSREISDESGYWLAKTLDRTGRVEESCSVFSKLAESSASPELADRALFEAAFIRKGQKKGAEALALLKRILLIHPASSLKQAVSWEIAWESYQAGDMKTAAEYFKPLTGIENFREKALYWYGHALSAAGNSPAAQGASATLLAEFPFGFYAQLYRKEVKLGTDDITFPAGALGDLLPLPAGFDRVKALITLGLYDEARKELAITKKKSGARNGSIKGLARLYLEMEDYNGAYNLLRNERPRRFEKDTIYEWGISYPLVYRDQVAKLAAMHNVPESLVYAIIRAESSFLPTALSPVGAVGLMQLMPSTAATIANGSKGKLAADSLTNPSTNIRFGIQHLRDLLTLYKGDLVLAIAAYNAGSGNVNRWRKSLAGLSSDEFVESIPYPETREYVKKVLSSTEIYSRMYKLANPTVATTLSSTPQPVAAESAEPPPPLPVKDSAVKIVTPIVAN
jgi:soluble lytic murein transglycosylase